MQNWSAVMCARTIWPRLNHAETKIGIKYKREDEIATDYPIARERAGGLRRCGLHALRWRAPKMADSKGRVRNLNKQLRRPGPERNRPAIHASGLLRAAES